MRHCLGASIYTGGHRFAVSEQCESMPKFLIVSLRSRQRHSSRKQGPLLQMLKQQIARLPRARWVDMTTVEFAQLPQDTIAVLPVAAIEQHGPHLPVFVDACINKAVVDRTIELLPSDLPVTVLPMQMIGKSNEHLAFPGTLSLSAETAIRLWTEIGEGVARAGIRKLVLLNSHGGQPDLARIVARDLRVRLSMLVVCANTYDLGVPPGAFPPPSCVTAFMPDRTKLRSCSRSAPTSSVWTERMISCRFPCRWSATTVIWGPRVSPDPAGRARTFIRRARAEMPRMRTTDEAGNA